MRRIALALAVASLPLVSVANEVEAVTYGDPVESPQIEFPEVVPVWVGGRALCTGTIIQQQIVLTAAHCVYGERGPFQISVGGSKLKNGRLIDIDATWYHPRWDERYIQNDIALLHLKSPANVSRLGNLPSSKMKTLGKKFLIVGWGQDQNGSTTGQLHRLSLNDQSATAAKVFESVYNPKTMLGAGRYFRDEMLYGGGCNGDSGGPLFQGVNGGNRTIIGLTSFGSAEGCTVYKPTIFTRVDFYVNVIQRGIQVVANRAIISPIGTGNATNPGIGPTTTTTVPKTTPTTSTSTTTTIPRTTTTTTIKPVASLEVTAISRYISASGEFSITVNSRTDNSALVDRVCLFVNGAPYNQIYSDGYGGWTRTAGSSCITNNQSKSFDNRYAASLTVVDPTGSQQWSVYANVYDTLGRSATSATLTFTS